MKVRHYLELTEAGYRLRFKLLGVWYEATGPASALVRRANAFEVTYLRSSTAIEIVNVRPLILE